MTAFIAVAIFIVSYALIASERFPRHAVALLGGLGLMVVGVFPVSGALARVDWETMGLIFGMFILVSVLAEAGFFIWLAAEVTARLNYRPTYVFLVFPLLAAVMAAFMGSITVMLFLAALSLHTARVIRIDPVPLVAAEVCAANIGGTATLVGNPPNVIMGTMLGFSFNAFLVHSAPLAVVAIMVVVGMFYLMNRHMLRAAEIPGAPNILGEDDRSVLITNRRLLKIGLAGFVAAIFLLAAKDALGPLLHVSLSTATAAMLPAVAVLAFGGDGMRRVTERLDFESLIFFVGLFIIVGGLEATGIIKVLAARIFGLAQGNHLALLAGLYWGSGFASGAIDNVPMALAMAYLVKDVAGLPGIPALAIMVWTLVMGLNVGGNLTPIGASPNVIAYACLERDFCRVGWLRWIRITAPPTLAAMLVVAALLALKYRIGWY